MNQFLKTFFTPRQIDYEYIALDSNRTIVEFSPDVARFADFPEEVKYDNDIELSFPELVGLESIFNQLLEDEISHFDLKGIARNSDRSTRLTTSPGFESAEGTAPQALEVTSSERGSRGTVDPNSPVYFDIYIFKNQVFTHLDGELVVLFDETTEWMIREQKYTQIYREYELSVSRLEQANHYINQIIHSMNDMLLVTNLSGMITRINQATQDILEYREDELINESIDHIFLDDFSQSTVKLLDFFSEERHSNCLEVQCKTKSGQELIISFSCSKFSINSFQSQEFLWIGRDITKQKQLELQVSNQLEQNRLLIEITQRIRQSLSLEKILQTTVCEVRKLLKVEGVLCYHFLDKNAGYIIANSFALNIVDHFKSLPQDILIPQHFLPVLEQGIITRVNDFNRSHLPLNLRNFWSKFEINSELIIPIIITNKSTYPSPENQLWGVLIAYQFHQNRPWKEWEILLLEQLTTPIAVAIQQAELYEQLRTGNQKLEEKAITDSLTQIFNRHFFEEILSKEWNRLRRDAAPLSLILCDLDAFKRYNDSYGHLAGDTCLQQVAQTLQKIGKRSGDLVARYEGDKFAILLPKTDLEGAILLSEEIGSQLRSLQIPHNNSLIKPYVTMSVGVSSIIPEVPLDPKTLILRADQALYEATINGGDRVFAAIN